MTIKLKDKALQKKLDEISNWDFSRALKENLFDRLCSPMDCKVTYRVFFGEPLDAFENRFSAVFREDEVEDVPEYDPNAWNDSRKVTPPEGVVFRAKVYRTSFIGETEVDYECLIYKNSGWYKVRDYEPLGGRLNLDNGEYVEFMPWEG